jgi:hypothetical protein
VVHHEHISAVQRPSGRRHDRVVLVQWRPVEAVGADGQVQSVVDTGPVWALGEVREHVRGVGRRRGARPGQDRAGADGGGQHGEAVERPAGQAHVDDPFPGARLTGRPSLLALTLSGSAQAGDRGGSGRPQWIMSRLDGTAQRCRIRPGRAMTGCPCCGLRVRVERVATHRQRSPCASQHLGPY